jgi:hypothetical protein
MESREKRKRVHSARVCDLADNKTHCRDCFEGARSGVELSCDCAYPGVSAIQQCIVPPSDLEVLYPTASGIPTFVSCSPFDLLTPPQPIHTAGRKGL